MYKFIHFLLLKDRENENLNLGSLNPASVCFISISHACVLSHFSSVWRFVTRQAPLSMGFSKAGIQKWVAISSSRGSSQPRDWTVAPATPALQVNYLRTEPPGKPPLYHITSQAPEFEWIEEILLGAHQDILIQCFEVNLELATFNKLLGWQLCTLKVENHH